MININKRLLIKEIMKKIEKDLIDIYDYENLNYECCYDEDVKINIVSKKLNRDTDLKTMYVMAYRISYGELCFNSGNFVKRKYFTK